MILLPIHSDIPHYIRGVQLVCLQMYGSLLGGNILVTMLYSWITDESFGFHLTAMFDRSAMFDYLFNPILFLWQHPLPALLRLFRSKCSRSDVGKAIKSTKLECNQYLSKIYNRSHECDIDREIINSQNKSNLVVKTFKNSLEVIQQWLCTIYQLVRLIAGNFLVYALKSRVKKP